MCAAGRHSNKIEIFGSDGVDLRLHNFYRISGFGSNVRHVLEGMPYDLGGQENLQLAYLDRKIVTCVLLNIYIYIYGSAKRHRVGYVHKYLVLG